MSKELRISILKDAKNNLLNKRFCLFQGIFIAIPYYHVKKTNCAVCIRGLLFCSLVDRTSKEESIYVHTSTAERTGRENKFLEQVFTKEELCNIENLFELKEINKGYDYGETLTCYNQIINTQMSDEERKLFLNTFGLVIINYMLKNNGYFISIEHFLKSFKNTKLYQKVLKTQLIEYDKILENTK